MSMYCDDTALPDGLPHFLLLLICSQIQTNHIRKAKEGSVIHKTTKKRPGGGKKTFLFALHVNRGHFPIHSIFNYTEVEQEGQVSLRGEAMKAALQLNMCTREISSLPWQWEGGKGCTYRSMRRKKSLQVHWAHVVLVQRHALLSLQHSHTLICTEHMLGQVQLLLHTHMQPCTCRDGWSRHDVWAHLHMPRQLNKRSLKQIWSQWLVPADTAISLQTLSATLWLHTPAECK